ncbi:MAG: hypothetical protein H7329_05135 [Opitutaceae bacterium]|nr:hypothetical protein [Cytophagales bacterium]
MKNYFKQSSLVVSSVLIAGMMMTGCKPKKNEFPVPPAKVKTDSVTQNPSEGTTGVVVPVGTGCQTSVNNFYAGQHTLAGTITVTNDAINLIVTYNTIDGWLLKHTHLYVGPKSGLPVGATGNPKIGNFPYSTEHSPMVTSFSYTIPLSKFEGESCIIIAAHAEVIKLSENGGTADAQTAWGAGKEITPGGSWATYSDYCICKASTGSTTGGTTTSGSTTSGSTTGSTTSGSTTEGTTTEGSTTSGTTTEGGTTTGTSGTTTGGMGGN